MYLAIRVFTWLHTDQHVSLPSNVNVLELADELYLNQEQENQFRVNYLKT